MLLNAMRADPTRTATLRRQFSAAITLRYRRLKQAILELVYERDVFGLGTRITVGNVRRVDVKELLRESAFKGGEGANPKKGLMDRSAAQKLWKLLYPDQGQPVTLKDLIEQYHKLGLRNYPDEETHRAVNDVWAEAAARFPREELERLVQQREVDYQPPRGAIESGNFAGGTYPAYLDEATPGLTDLLRTKLGARSDQEPEPPPPVPMSTVPPPPVLTLPPVVAPVSTQPREAPPVPVGVSAPGLSNPNKVKRFRAWVRGQMDSGLAGDALIEAYIDAGYRKGTERAFDDLRRGGAATGDEKADLKRQGAKEEFTRIAMTKQATVGKVKLLAARTFHDLEDVNVKMGARMSRILVDALVQGWSPAKAAREMVKQVGLEEGRALTIVRTELVRAHAEGQLDALEQLGETQVGVMAEWVTAHDARVCEKCRWLDGQILKLADARGMIPMHPNCRCAWIPLKERGRR